SVPFGVAVGRCVCNATHDSRPAPPPASIPDTTRHSEKELRTPLAHASVRCHGVRPSAPTRSTEVRSRRNRAMNVTAVPDIPEIRAGDDLAEMIAERADLRSGDIVCVASTVVSKAEGRAYDLADFPAGPRATEIATRLGERSGDEKDPRFAQAVLEESTDLLMESPFLLTETRFGHVCVNAGIDRSNVPDNDLLCLPKRPSRTAERLADALGVPVIITDTCG